MSIFETLADCGCNKPDCYFCWLRGRVYTTTYKPVGQYLTLEDIFNKICKATEIDQAEVKSPSRKTKASLARHFYCVIAHKTTKATVAQISTVIRRDRTLVYYAEKKLENLLYARDKQCIAMYDLLCRAFGMMEA